MPIVRNIEERDLADRADEVLDEIRKGVEYVIVRGGDAVARLVRANEDELNRE